MERGGIGKGIGAEKFSTWVRQMGLFGAGIFNTEKITVDRVHCLGHTDGVHCYGNQTLRTMRRGLVLSWEREAGKVWAV